MNSSRLAHPSPRFWLLLSFMLGLLFVLPTNSTVAQDTPETRPAEELADENGSFLEVDGVSLYLIDAGSADAPVVILLHGFGGSTFTWRDLQPRLVEAGYRVIAYDRPPFGLSAKRSDLAVSPMAYAGQLAALMDALDIQHAHLLGHSAGGGVIAHFASLYPERVDSLVFVAGAVSEIGADPEESNSSESGMMGGLGAGLDPNSPLARQLVRTFMTRERFVGLLEDAYAPAFAVTDEVRDGYARVLQVNDWELGFLALMNQDEGEPLNTEALAQLEAPVLLIWGALDTWVPLERGEALQAFFNDAPLLIFPDAGHMVPEEDPDGFYDAVSEFLATVEAG